MFIFFLIVATVSASCEEVLNATSDGCAYEQLTCANGGRYLTALCARDVRCVNRRHSRGCVCAPGYGGADCRGVDGECYLADADAARLALYEHRVQLAAGGASRRLWARRRRDGDGLCGPPEVIAENEQVPACVGESKQEKKSDWWWPLLLLLLLLLPLLALLRKEEEQAQQQEVNFNLRFRGVTVRLPDGRVLLDGVGGDVRAGEVVAVMGASGAGKSTLLDVLAGRRAASSAASRVVYDGGAWRPARACDAVAYVEQADTALPTLSVRETLLLAARLRLPPGADAAGAVRRVLEQLRLTHVAEARVVGGVSGGERRRAAIAAELLAAPCVLLLDEPLSGLDSEAARVVLDALRRYATETRAAVLLTLHQPSRDLIARAIDRVYVLGAHGKFTYAGAAQDEDLEELIERADGQAEEEAPIMDEDRKLLYRRRRISSLHAFALLLQRNLRNVWREPRLMLAQWFVTLLVAAAVGAAFYDAPYGLKGLQSRQGVLFFSVLYFSVISLSALPLLLEHRAHFERERAAGAYGAGAHFAATFLADLLPLRVLPPLAFTAIVYYLVGLNSPLAHAAAFAGAVVLVNLVATSLCFAVAALVPHAASANALAALIFVLSLLFGGLLLNNHSRQSPLAYAQYASFARYAYELLMLNEFEHNKHAFYFDPQYNGHTLANQTISGAEWVENVGMDLGAGPRDAAILGGAIVLLNVLSLIGLAIKRKS